MRDVDGSIAFCEQTVVRRIHPEAAAKPFLHSPRGTALVQEGKLIPFRFTDADTSVSPRLPFVSYPFEWCDAQLHRAAQLTLDVSRDILAEGYELKDASAWNVIFEGNRALFCDHLSFQPVTTRQWWAFGQFTRHFLLPLAVSKKRGLKPHRTFSTWRDGMPPDAARELFGAARYLTRYWPLMAAKEGGNDAGGAAEKPGKAMHGNLYALCQHMLDGAKPRGSGKSAWSRYTEERRHYSTEASRDKERRVATWLERIAPAWVVDLGCNSGEYSHLAAKTGASVIAVDLDHDAIERIVLTHHESSAIHPVVCNLGDMVGGRGWSGDEFPSLMQRLARRADVLLMLALVHHLAISEAISLAQIAHMAAHVTRSYLIVELLVETDPMVQLLCSQRRRNPQDFAVALQEAAFAAHFDVVESHAIPGTGRKLCLLKKKDA
jgi:ribosomal protein L11 methylase PrmA